MRIYFLYRQFKQLSEINLESNWQLLPLALVLVATSAFISLICCLGLRSD